MNIKKSLFIIVLCMFGLYSQVAPMQEVGTVTEEDSALVLSGIEAARWLEQNFADPIQIIEDNLDYFRYIYNVNISDPKSVISILKNPPFDLVSFSDEEPLHLSRQDILLEKLQKINKNVRSLDLRYNDLYYNYPRNLTSKNWQDIRKMTHLRKLDLSLSDLGFLPIEYWRVIVKMTHLRSLNLGGNKLNELPFKRWQEIGKMTHLRELDLRCNDLDTLPVKHWRVIAKMTHLRSLDLRWNYLHRLPVTNLRIQLIEGMQEQGVIIIE